MTASDIDLKRLQRVLKGIRTAKKPKDSVRKFAKGAAISYTHVAQMEGRKRKTDLKKSVESAPTILMLHRYLQYCGISLVQFFADFEGEEPDGLTPDQAALLDAVRVLIRAGPDVERRIQERIEEVRAWLTIQEESRDGPNVASGTLGATRGKKKKSST